MRNVTKVLMIIAVLAFVASPAVAQLVEDNFHAEIDAAGTVTGGGTGYNGGEWYYYPDSGWWNQWFYDHPVNPPNWKEMWAVVDIMPIESVGYVEIAFNWSTLDWSPNPFDPPLPPLDEFIVRETFFVGEVVEMMTIDGGVVIPDYNPEWVSIDIMGEGVVIDGILWHECIPEPATMSLLVLGGIGALMRRRRK
ncbi:MAG: PEP-CTERM sorting domain-containing protein [Phycisphaerae bacterium]|nr:PEP-CTERM sorting domain-containing protein [Phycisphaerae bacterium]